MANLHNVHLTPDDGTEDLYSGYEYSAIADVSSSRYTVLILFKATLQICDTLDLFQFSDL